MGVREKKRKNKQDNKQAETKPAARHRAAHPDLECQPVTESPLRASSGVTGWGRSSQAGLPRKQEAGKGRDGELVAGLSPVTGLSLRRPVGQADKRGHSMR